MTASWFSRRPCAGACAGGPCPRLPVGPRPRATACGGGARIVCGGVAVRAAWVSARVRMIVRTCSFILWVVNC